MKSTELKNKNMFLRKLAIRYLLRQAGNRVALRNWVNDVVYEKNGVPDFTLRFAILLSAIRNGAEYESDSLYAQRDKLKYDEASVLTSALSACNFSDANSKPACDGEGYDVYFQGSFVRRDRFEGKLLAQICAALKKEFATDGMYVKTKVGEKRIDVKLYAWQDQAELRRQRADSKTNKK